MGITAKAAISRCLFLLPVPSLCYSVRPVVDVPPHFIQTPSSRPLFSPPPLAPSYHTLILPNPSAWSRCSPSVYMVISLLPDGRIHLSRVIFPSSYRPTISDTHPAHSMRFSHLHLLLHPPPPTPPPLLLNSASGLLKASKQMRICIL